MLNKLIIFFLCVPSILLGAGADQVLHSPDCCAPICSIKGLRPLWREFDCCSHYIATEVEGMSFEEKTFFYKSWKRERTKVESIAGCNVWEWREKTKPDQARTILTELLTFGIYEIMKAEKYTTGKPRFINACDGSICQVNKFMEARNLHTILQEREGSPFKAEDASYAWNLWATFVARHQDAKPRNIMVTPMGELISTDHEVGLFDPVQEESLSYTALLGLSNFHDPVHPDLLAHLFDKVGISAEAWIGKIDAMQAAYQEEINSTIKELIGSEFDLEHNPALKERLICEFESVKKGVRRFEQLSPFMKLLPSIIPLHIQERFDYQEFNNQLTYHRFFELLVSSHRIHEADNDFSLNYEGKPIPPCHACEQCKKTPSDQINIFIRFLKAKTLDISHSCTNLEFLWKQMGMAEKDITKYLAQYEKMGTLMAADL